MFWIYGILQLMFLNEWGCIFLGKKDFALLFFVNKIQKWIIIFCIHTLNLNLDCCDLWSKHFYGNLWKSSLNSLSSLFDSFTILYHRQFRLDYFIAYISLICIPFFFNIQWSVFVFFFFNHEQSIWSEFTNPILDSPKKNAAWFS